MKPAARNTAHRLGFGTPANYNDNEVFCGGQHQSPNVDNCGVCGDPLSLPKPRPNENGGKWGTGTITKTYYQGSVIS